MRHIKISGIVHTYNEEKNIAACLDTLKWCDEIIIIDMYSQDKTANISRNYTDKIFFHKKMNYADPARQFGLSKAKGDWVLVLDADERLPSQLVSVLKNISEKDKADVVYLPWKNIIFGKWIKHTQWWPDYHPRFFKKKFMQYTDNIHNFENSEGRKYYLPAKEKNAVIHYNYRDVDHFKEKTGRYTNIEAKKLYSSGKKFYIWQLIYFPIKEFVWRFILGKGFLDGWYGFKLSCLMFRYKFLTYRKLWKLKKK
ncbi:MAG: glycosyltransferase family 2 protein [Patescibacteria group bacterium]|nr:glycosyltransferase family 2 protein [Patescibacteria group bacterium]